MRPSRGQQIKAIPAWPDPAQRMAHAKSLNQSLLAMTAVCLRFRAVYPDELFSSSWHSFAFLSFTTCLTHTYIHIYILTQLHHYVSGKFTCLLLPPGCVYRAYAAGNQYFSVCIICHNFSWSHMLKVFKLNFRHPKRQQKVTLMLTWFCTWLPLPIKHANIK